MILTMRTGNIYRLGSLAKFNVQLGSSHSTQSPMRRLDLKSFVSSSQLWWQILKLRSLSEYNYLHKINAVIYWLHQNAWYLHAVITGHINMCGTYTLSLLVTSTCLVLTRCHHWLHQHAWYLHAVITGCINMHGTYTLSFFGIVGWRCVVSNDKEFSIHQSRVSALVYNKQ